MRSARNRTVCSGSELFLLDLLRQLGTDVLVARAPGYRPRVTEPFKVEHNMAYRATGLRLVRGEVVAGDVELPPGTQALVERDPSLRFVSLHQWPWYPGTGAASERGVGNVFNVPRPPGLPPERYVADLWEAVEAATSGWPPDLVLLSAGYDAMRDDPLGGFTEPPLVTSVQALTWNV